MKKYANRVSVFLRAVLISAVTAGAVAVLLSWQGGLHTARIARDGLLQLSDEVTKAVTVGIAPAVKFRKADDIIAEVKPTMARSGGTALVALAFDAEGTVISSVAALGQADAEPSGEASLLAGDEAIAAVGKAFDDGEIATGMAEFHGMIAAAITAGAPIVSEDGLTRVELIFGKDGAVAGGLLMKWTDAKLQAAISAETLMVRLQALAFFVVLSGCAAVLLRSSISLPLRRVGGAISTVAQADYKTLVPECERGDEIGALARDLDRLRLRLAEVEADDLARAEEQAAQAQVVEKLRAALGRLAAGDLTCRIDHVFPAAYDVLREDLNAVIDRLSDTLGKVTSSAARINSSTEKINRSSDELSRRTENQAATLEESVAAVSELTVALRQAADDTRKVAAGLARSQSQAGESQSIVQSAVTAMSEIRKSSDQISRIIGVIEDIAFQTNLLALNAGVEAARAGEAGRGFSVVASEVRALAQRTSDSAKEIKALIHGSATEVLRGVELVDRTGSALSLILAEVEGVANIASGLSTVISTQSAGLSEISMGMSQLDQVTQQNAGMVEQMVGAQRVIREDIEHLTELVSGFRLTEGSGEDLSFEEIRMAS
jgi:methyl-accepting chemotaxis protein